MFIFVLLFSLLANQVVSEHTFGEPVDPAIPRECATVTDLKLARCCPVKPLFTKEILNDCGVSQSTGPWFADWFIGNCAPSTCVFEKYYLISSNRTILYPQFQAMLAVWSKHQPRIKMAVKEAESKCIRTLSGSPVPQKPFVSEPAAYNHCETHKLYTCMWLVTLWNCKLKEDIFCNDLKEKVRTCRPYLFKHEDHS